MLKYLIVSILLCGFTSFGQEIVPEPPIPDCIEQSEQDVVDYVNILPEFPGGSEKMMSFISSNFIIQQ